MSKSRKDQTVQSNGRQVWARYTASRMHKWTYVQDVDDPAERKKFMRELTEDHDRREKLIDEASRKYEAKVTIVFPASQPA